MKDVLVFILVVPVLFVVTLYLSQYFYQCTNSAVLLICLVITLLISWSVRVRIKNQRIAVKTLLVLLSVFSAFFILVFLSSLNETRNIGNDSRVKGVVSGLRTHAEIYMSEVGSYKNFCNSPVVQQASKVILTSKTSCYGPVLKYFFEMKELTLTTTCNATDDEYAVDGFLPNAKQYFCVDDTGQSQTVSRSLGTQTRCSE